MLLDGVPDRSTNLRLEVAQVLGGFRGQHDSVPHCAQVVPRSAAPSKPPESAEPAALNRPARTPPAVSPPSSGCPVAMRRATSPVGRGDGFGGTTHHPSLGQPAPCVSFA